MNWGSNDDPVGNTLVLIVTLVIMIVSGVTAYKNGVAEWKIAACISGYFFIGFICWIASKVRR